MLDYHPFLLADFYKIGHVVQYPEDTEYTYLNWTARASRLDGVDHVVAFGFQAFIKEYLIDYFQEQFFDKTSSSVVREYQGVISKTLGAGNPKTDHIEALWELGYLPLEIKAVPEGTLVPLRVPMLTIENTHPDFFWLPGALETLFSVNVWHPSTSATIAHEYRKLLDKFAVETVGSTDYVNFQGHDFSMRGMESVEGAERSGMGHLLSFVGTDTIPAILGAEKYYGARIDKELVGTSIPATEHSVMEANGREGELETYRRLITEVYPSGFAAIVSDTYDLWNVVGPEGILHQLHDEIMNRDGKIVIRPDSGDPVDIICGWDPQEMGYTIHEGNLTESKGVVECLWDEFGGTVNELGYKVLDPHIGAIYGDSITLDRARQILQRLKDKGFASSNIVFGIGSFTYQYVTRDTFSFALKETNVIRNGVEIQVFKDPITDKKHEKKSLKGRVVVRRNKDSGELYVLDHLDKRSAAVYDYVNLLQPIFRDGQLLRNWTFEEVRSNLRNG